MRPEDLPPVELESMNRDHRDQVEAINAVLAAIDASDGSPRALALVDAALEEFAEHTQEHFRQEDDQMRRYAFAAFEAHTAEHARALERMRQRLEGWRDRRDVADLDRYVREEFPAWLVNHVTVMDTVSALYIAGKAH